MLKKVIDNFFAVPMVTIPEVKAEAQAVLDVLARFVDLSVATGTEIDSNHDKSFFF